MDGFELTRRLKASSDTRDIAVLAISASSTPIDEQKAREAGCDACVEKTFDARTFPELVAGMLPLPSGSP